MTSLFPLAALSLAAVFLLKVIGELAPKFRFLLLAGCAVLLFYSLFSFLQPSFTYLSELMNRSALSPYFSVLLKGAGLALLTELAASFCRDLGEETVAGHLEGVGKAAILALSLPLIKQIVDLIGALSQ